MSKLIENPIQLPCVSSFEGQNKTVSLDIACNWIDNSRLLGE